MIVEYKLVYGDLNSVIQVKEMCRRELERLEADNSRNTAIIADYKLVLL